jgi:uncharacterized protein
MNPVRPAPTFRPRHQLPTVTTALCDTRVVLITGPRQAGKSTMARLSLSPKMNPKEVTLDEARMLAAARDDPAGFVQHEGTLFIDEIQRAPELLLAIKAVVDRSNRPGQFLLTGSANVLNMPRVADALPGRMEIVTLWPFSQGEIEGQVDGFVDRLFANSNHAMQTTLRKADYLGRAVCGGFPEIVMRSEGRRRPWFESYIQTLIQHDIQDLASVEQSTELSALLRLIAARSGQLLNLEELARDARLSPTTARRYMRLLESAYVIKTVPGWATSKTTRSIRAPKIFIADSGLLCHLLNVTVDGLASPGGEAGHVLESFVVMEITRQLGWSQTRANLHHFRTKDGTEVDVVLETPDGRIAGVEVKAGATVRSNDFRGLRLLSSKVGSRFAGGVVLYAGTDTLSFGNGLKCVPLGALWQSDT